MTEPKHYRITIHVEAEDPRPEQCESPFPWSLRIPLILFFLFWIIVLGGILIAMCTVAYAVLFA